MRKKENEGNRRQNGMSIVNMIRKYISVDDIQKEYLPVSKKKIRCLLKRYLDIKQIGNRIFVERESFEKLLSDTSTSSLPLT